MHVGVYGLAQDELTTFTGVVWSKHRYRSQQAHSAGRKSFGSVSSL